MSGSPTHSHGHLASLRKVVIAIDASQSSWQAFEFALGSVVDPTRDNVVLTTVAMIPEGGWLESIATGLAAESAFVPYPSSAGVSPTAQDQMAQRADREVHEAEAAATDLLNKAKRHVREHFASCGGADMAIRTAVLQANDPRDALVDYINSEKAAMLVIGSRGLGAIKRALLGSVSEYCLHHVSCPVLIVKPEMIAAASPNAPAAADRKAESPAH
ncbi:hypothetical protein BC828DRAFT_390069 [Blastocladiella britannica]|nr:hypothetical protein BC828DRAFT_390069 [Blastocladiella britannica]